MIRFAQPDTLYLLAILPALGLLFWLSARLRRAAMERFGNLPLLSRLSDAAGNAKRMAMVVLILLAVGMVIVGLANPQVGTRMEEVKQEGIDLFIALDVSLSMKAEDVKPNRLEKARLEQEAYADRGGDPAGAAAQRQLLAVLRGAGLLGGAVPLDRRRLVRLHVAAVAFAFLYQITAFDSRNAARQADLQEDRGYPTPGVRLRFAATAYCRGTTTASGVGVRSGIAAADPALLPVGSVIHIDSLPEKYNGVYTIMDTGPKVQGRHIDVYMWSCDEAVEFGRRPVRLTVLRLGWSPRASSPRIVSRLFEQREAARSARPVRVSQPPPGATPAPDVK